MTQLSQKQPSAFDMSANEGQIKVKGRHKGDNSVSEDYEENQKESELEASPSNSKWKAKWQKILLVFVIVMMIFLGAVYFWQPDVQEKGKEKVIEKVKEKVIEEEKEVEKVKEKRTEIEKEKEKEKEKVTIIDKCTPYQLEFIELSRAGKQKQQKVKVIWPGVVIDVAYSQKNYSHLPINLMRKNPESKRIEDVLYKDEATRKKRVEFIQQRANFVNSNSKFSGFLLSRYNLVSSEDQAKKGVDDNRLDWLRLEAKFRLSQVKEELPMCIVAVGYNNNANFRIESNLNSIFTQNYTNYKLVLVDDASPDGSNELYRSFFRFYAIDKQRYTYIENSRQTTALENIYFASMNHCSKDSIVVTLDADDEFIGRNVLQVFNWAYQTKKAGVIYSNFYWYRPLKYVDQGFTAQYTDQQKKGNLYRDIDAKFSQLRTYKNELLHQIDPKDLQDYTGRFYQYTYDQALFFPLMELSCGRVYKIEGEFHYLYNTGTAWNYPTQSYTCNQAAIARYVRRQPKYECFKQFDKRMSL